MTTILEPAAPMRRPLVRRRLFWGAAIGLLLLAVFAGWVTYRSVQAYRALTSAKATIAADLQLSVGDLTELDATALGGTISSFQHDASAARNAVEDPLYRLARYLPWVGDDLSAVASVAVAVDELAQQVVPALVSLADAADPAQLEPHDSTINLDPIVAAAKALRAADDIVAANIATIAGVDRTGLTTTVGTAVADLAGKLDDLHSVTDTGARLTALLPPMLGSDGPRRYLVVFQNIAELRSTGGIFGNYAVLTIDNGHLDVSGQGATSRTMGRFAEPVVPLTAEQVALYDTNVGTVPMDVNFTPDFPTAAQLFSTMYQQRIDPTPLDGVIAIDPVALADILKGFEPVAVTGEVLTSDNLVKLLLSDAYSMFPDDKDQSQRDAFLAEATATSFRQMTTTPRDVAAVVAGLRRSVESRRLLFYSNHSAEQTELRSVGYTGQLPAQDTAGAPTFGIFPTDRTHMGSKLGYYLSGSAVLAAGSCQVDGTREVTATMTLQFDGPSSGLPEYVSGNGPTPYVLTTELRAFAPTGATVTAAEFNGAPVTLTIGTDLDRVVGRLRVDLQPGSTNTVTVHFTLPAADSTQTASGSTIQPTLLLAPGVKPWPITAPAYQSC